MLHIGLFALVFESTLLFKNVIVKSVIVKQNFHCHIS